MKFFKSSLFLSLSLAIVGACHSFDWTSFLDPKTAGAVVAVIGVIKTGIALVNRDGAANGQASQ